MLLELAQTVMDGKSLDEMIRIFRDKGFRARRSVCRENWKETGQVIRS
jgi:hypothetical protein